MTSNVINNQLFDSRDLAQEHEEFQEELVNDIKEYIEKHYPDIDPDIITCPEDIDEIDDKEAVEDILDVFDIELSDWREYDDFVSTLRMNNEFDYGMTIIHEDYFTEYAEDTVKEVGYVSDTLPWWIKNHIDWDGVADEMKADYQKAEYQGETYYYR